MGWLGCTARDSETTLDWEKRIRIATGAAHGLLHLHSVEKMVHGNLTATNILLDTSMYPTINACISGYGLSCLMTPVANGNIVATTSSLGYCAPELTKIKKASTKSDVYSFGIILLELLTGVVNRFLNFQTLWITIKSHATLFAIVVYEVFCPKGERDLSVEDADKVVLECAALECVMEDQIPRVMN